MKAFIKNTISFSLFVICIAFFFQAIISFKIKNKSLNNDDNLEQTSNINADLVLIGSSRCWVHFDPAFFDQNFKTKSINIGVNGHTEVATTILRLKNYLSRNTPPRFAILSFDPEMESGSELDNGNFINKDYYARYSFWPSDKNLAIVNYFKFTYAEKYVPLYSIFKYKLLDDCLFIKTKKYNRNFNYLVDKKWDTIHNPVQIERFGNYFTKKHMISLANSLEKLKKLCSDHNIKLLFIHTPMYKSIQDDSSFKNSKIISDMVNIPLIDVNKPHMSNNINYFYNSAHLNKEGVTRMNEMLKTDTQLISFFKDSK